jgi:RNA polymerase sigma factor (sigma-70 family)
MFYNYTPRIIHLCNPSRQYNRSKITYFGESLYFAFTSLCPTFILRANLMETGLPYGRWHKVNIRIQTNLNDPLHHLVRQSQSGVPAATAELTAQFMPLLRKAANKYRRISYEDALQEACLAFLEGIAEYNRDLGIPFPGYIQRKVLGEVRTAMRRLWRTESRKARLVYASSEESELDPWNDLALKCPSAEGRIQDVVTLLWLDSAGLSHRERLAAHALLQGFTCKEVAAAVGVGTESVKTWRKRALRKLKTAFSDEG